MRKHSTPKLSLQAHVFDLMDQVAVRRHQEVRKDSPVAAIAAGGRGIHQSRDADVRRVDYQLDEPGDALVHAVTYALHIPDDEAHVASFDVRRSDPERLLLARYVPAI